ncbi:MAG: ZIP family metal transporter [Patescibacteria group bacterium]
MLFEILLATIAISLLSFSGVLLVFLRAGLLERISILLVALAAGALMGAAFLHLLPEAIEKGLNEYSFLTVLIGFLMFFLLEKSLHWHHSHQATHKHFHLGVLSLTGDFIHNFVDGLIIAASFLVSLPLGITVSAAMALHEIPQEISEFGVLLYAGFRKTRALLLNFFSASSVILGGIVGYGLGGMLEPWIPCVIFFAVGSFLYLGASDFVPEIRKEEGARRSMVTFSVFVLGIALMWAFTFLE